MKKYEVNMTKGPLLGKIIRFAIPVLLSGWLQLLFNAIDMIVVGKFVGDDALAAVGATNQINNLFVNMVMGLGIGTNVYVGKYYGAKRYKEMNETLHTSIITAFFGSVAIALVTIFFARPLLTLMDTPAEILDQSVLYITIVLCGSAFNMVYNYAAAALRAVGDTKRPLYFLLIAGASNAVLNVFCVVVLKLGVAGVAIATVFSQAISAFLIIRTLMKSDGELHFSFKELKFKPRYLKEISMIGIPSGLQGAVFSTSNIVVQSAINSFGTAAVAGNTASSSIEGFVYTAMNSLYHTNISVTSQNLGARKPKRMLKSLAICECISISVGLFLAAVTYTFGTPLLSIYTDNPEAIAFGLYRVIYLGIPYFICGAMDVMVGSLRGMGSSVLPAISSILGCCGVRIIYINTIFKMYPTPEVLFLVYPVSWLFTLIMHSIFLVFQYKKVKKHLNIE